MVNTNINQQSLEPQKHAIQYGGSNQSSGSFNATRSFQEGLSGATARALLDVMDDDLMIALLSGRQTMEQVNNQKDIGTALCSFQEQVGTKMFEDKLTQGLTGMASAGVTLGVAGVTSMESDPSLEEAEQNLKGAKSYKDAIEEQTNKNLELSDAKTSNTSTEPKIEADQAEQTKVKEKEPLNPEDIQKRLDDLKDRTSFVNSDKEAVDVSTETDEKLGVTDKEFIDELTPEELSDLKKSIDSRVEEIQKQRDQLVSIQQSKLSTRTTLTSSFGDIFKSTGSVASGEIEKEQSDLQGQIAAGQSAQSIAQGNTNQVRGMIDKFMGEIAGITQIMAAIANAGTPQ